MINRELIRIKVVQLTYAYYQNGEKNMDKKEYIEPRLNTIRIEAHRLMAGSQVDVPVNNPNDEVDAGDAL